LRRVISFWNFLA